MRRLVIMIAGFVLALGLMFGLGHAFRALTSVEPAPVCPDLPLAARLDGQIVGLAHVPMERVGGILAGSLPERPDGMPEAQPERLTVVQHDRLFRTRNFDYRPRGELERGRQGFHLTVPPSSLELATPVMFVTSACIPDHPVKLKVWQTQPHDERPENLVEEDRLRQYLQGVLPAEYARAIAASRPRLIASFTAAIPDCERPAVLGDHNSKADRFAALVCLGPADSIARTLIPPVHGGSPIREVGVLDIDGDGHDELIVNHYEPMVSGTYAVDTTRTTLLTHDAAKNDIVLIDLGTALP